MKIEVVSLMSGIGKALRSSKGMSKRLRGGADGKLLRQLRHSTIT